LRLAVRKENPDQVDYDRFFEILVDYKKNDHFQGTAADEARLLANSLVNLSPQKNYNYDAKECPVIFGDYIIAYPSMYYYF